MLPENVTSKYVTILAIRALYCKQEEVAGKLGFLCNRVSGSLLWPNRCLPECPLHSQVDFTPDTKQSDPGVRLMICPEVSAIWQRLYSFLCCLQPRRLRNSKSVQIISMPRLRRLRRKSSTPKQFTKLLPRNGLHLVWARPQSESLRRRLLGKLFLHKTKPAYKHGEPLTPTGTEDGSDFSIYLTH
jgi:hypothetical protein